MAREGLGVSALLAFETASGRITWICGVGRQTGGRGAFGCTRLRAVPPSGSASLTRIIANLPDEAMASLLTQAEVDRDAALAPLPARLYHQFRDTGVREGYEDAQRLRRNGSIG